jgi:hypothetical protein
MATVHISDRKVNKSVRKAINEIHGDPIWGYVEATINAFSAMRHMQPRERVVCINLKAGKNGQDSYIVAPGTGMRNYDYIEKNIGYDTDAEEYIQKQRDPDYLNKMGIGIPSIASLSKDGIAEFRSVHMNSKGQEEGLVATYTLQDGGGFIIPAEHPDSKYVFTFDGAEAKMKTGVWVIVRNVKSYPLEKVKAILSEVFARKLNAGYHIMIRESMKDEFVDIRPPNDFCSKHEVTIGYVHDTKFGDFPIQADIHRVDKTQDATVRILMKKMTIDKFESKYLAKGYAGCNILDYKPDREGISIDQYNNNYMQYRDAILLYYKNNNFEEKPTEQMKNLKNEKKWKEKMKEVFINYYRKNPFHRILNVNAIPSATELPGKPRPMVTRPRKRCDDGYHWDKKLQACIPNTEAIGRIYTPPIRTGGPHKPPVKLVPKKTKLDNEFTDQSIPDFIPLKGCDENKFCVYINEAASAIIFNTFYPWINEVWDNPTDKIMELLLTMALMNAVQDNQGVSAEEFLRRLAHQL